MMRMLLFGLLGAWTPVSFAALVTVEVDQPDRADFRVSYLEDHVTGRRKILKLELRDGGRSTFEVLPETPRTMSLTYAGAVVPLYVDPDADLSVAFAADDPLGSVTYVGETARSCAFMAAYARLDPPETRTEWGGGFLPVPLEASVRALAATGSVELYRDSVESKYARQRRLLEAHRAEVPSDVVDAYDTRTQADRNRRLAAFAVLNRQLYGPEELPELAQQLGITPANAFTDPRLLGIEAFKDYLRAYAQLLALPNSGAHDERTASGLYAAVRDNVDRPWRHFLQSEILVNAFDYLGNPDFGLERYAEMLRDGVREVYRTRVENAYGDVLNLTAGALAPNIGMQYADGRPVSLTDLGGEVVYISFWASWCKPCLINFEKYDGVRAELEQMGVALLNVNIDATEAAWRTSLAAEGIRGIHTRATNLDATKRTYNLASIPAYYVVNRAGEIVDLPEGRDRDLLGAFRDLVASEGTPRQ